jgi:hypothetical protein
MAKLSKWHSPGRVSRLKSFDECNIVGIIPLQDGQGGLRVNLRQPLGKQISLHMDLAEAQLLRDVLTKWIDKGIAARVVRMNEK